jgi:hypothetical protein
VRALSDIPAGVEVCCSYGLKTNRRLLLNYGFCVHPPYDDVEVVIFLQRDYPAYEQKMLLLNEEYKMHKYERQTPPLYVSCLH